MSATIGTWQPRACSSLTMLFRLAASLTVGAVMRTIWQPTATSSRVCFTHSAVSIVSQVIINCTTMGGTRPIITPPRAGSPSITSREGRRRKEKGDSQKRSVLIVPQRRTLLLFDRKPLIVEHGAEKRGAPY